MPTLINTYAHGCRFDIEWIPKSLRTSENIDREVRDEKDRRYLKGLLKRTGGISDKVWNHPSLMDYKQLVAAYGMSIVCSCLLF